LTSQTIHQNEIEAQHQQLHSNITYLTACNMCIWSNPINLICISIFQLLNFEYSNTNHIDMTQYGKILQYCTSIPLGFFGMWHNNPVLQLLHVCKKSSLQVTHISHMYAWQSYKIEYCQQQVNYTSQLYPVWYWNFLHNSHHIFYWTTEIMCTHMYNACVQSS